MPQLGTRRLLIVVTAVLALSLPSWRDLAAAGQEALPPGRQIVAQFVTAIGGQSAFASIKSVRARGRFEIAAQRIAGDVEILSARPAKLLNRVMVPGLGRIETGYDGTIGWTVSPISGPELLVGRQLAETADDSLFDGPLHPPAQVKELTTLGRAEFDGRPAYKVRVVFASGNTQTEYFDIETKLQIGSESSRATPQGVIDTVNILRNYKKFGPIMQATTFTQRALGFEQTLTLTSYEYDVVPDSAFEPPAEIKALVTR